MFKYFNFKNINEQKLYSRISKFTPIFCLNIIIQLEKTMS